MSDTNMNHETAYRIPKDSVWAQAWKVSLVIGLLGLAVGALGASINATRFAYSYLFGFVTALTIGVGSLFFILIQHLTSAGWSVTVRRTGEFLASGMLILPLLFVPVAFMMDELYPWSTHGHDEGVAHAQPPHGAELGAARPDLDHEAGAPDAAHGPVHAQHAEILESKRPYLNKAFFYGRAVVFFLIWLWITVRLIQYSTQQDRDGNPELTVKLQRFAPPATILWALVTTYAGVDWLMSLEPNWYSTMWGVHLFASSAVTIFGLVILMTMGLRRAGIVGDEINVEHFHDLGKLQFGFLVFWGYITFSQFMLIWYAALPEETIFYHRRWDHDGWHFMSLALVGLHFIVPFYLIMSRNAKRKLPALGFGAAWILVMHVVEMYWIVLPYYAEHQDIDFSLVWLDLACMLGVVGIYMTVVFRSMLRHPVIPIRDPRLQRALDFVNA